MIELLTFTGVDEHTSFPKLLDLAHLYPAVEFAVLVGSPTGTGTKPRFPRLEVAHRLRGLGVDHSQNTSIHLCGRFAKEALDPRGPDPGVLDLCDGFGRVQVNLAGRAFQKGRRNRTVAAISRFANEVGCGSVIVQHRGRWEDVPLRHPRVEYLFDRSGGRGQTAFDHWPAPIGQPPRVGYSGGLGPQTIGDAMRFTDRHPDSPLWLDMESGVRDRADRFDLRAVENVCQTVWPD